MQLNELRWKELNKRITGKYPDDAIFINITEQYSQTHRHYHNVDHVINCLVEFDNARHLAEYPDELEFAIWMHDLIYNPQANDNEEKSSLFAAFTLLDSDCADEICDRVQILIMTTKHNVTPANNDAGILTDIDLSILGKNPEIYDIYEKNIYKEYSWVPIDAYIKGRTEVLESFLNRDKIYYSDYFEVLYEKQARINMTKAISDLKNLNNINK